MKKLINIIIIVVVIGILLTTIFNYFFNEYMIKNRTIINDKSLSNIFLENKDLYSSIVDFIKTNNIEVFITGSDDYFIGFKDSNNNFYSCLDNYLEFKSLLNNEKDIKMIDCKSIKNDLKETYIYSINIPKNITDIENILIDKLNYNKTIKFYLKPKKYDRKGLDYFLYSNNELKFGSGVLEKNSNQEDVYYGSGFRIIFMNKNWLIYEINR